MAALSVAHVTLITVPARAADEASAIETPTRPGPASRPMFRTEFTPGRLLLPGALAGVPGIRCGDMSENDDKNISRTSQVSDDLRQTTTRQAPWRVAHQTPQTGFSTNALHYPVLRSCQYCENHHNNQNLLISVDKCRLSA